MEPFVGQHYESNRHKKLLLIGESFYVTQQSTNPQLNVKKWYEGKIYVSPDDKGYCSPAATRNQTTGFGPVVKRNLQLICPTNGDVWEEVAFYNYFIRPAKNGQSIRDLWKITSPEDIEMDHKKALENFLQVIDVLKPDVFVMLSELACEQSAEPDYERYHDGKYLWTSPEFNIIKDHYIYTPHPTSSWWNRPMKNRYHKFTNYKGKKPNAQQPDYSACDFFIDWLTDNWMY